MSESNIDMGKAPASSSAQDDTGAVTFGDGKSVVIPTRNIPILTGLANWAQWEMLVKLRLRSFKCHEVLLATPTDPIGVAKDDAVVCFFTMVIHQDVLFSMQGKDASAKTMWTHLRGCYGTKGILFETDIIEEFVKCQRGSFASGTEWLAKFEACKQQVVARTDWKIDNRLLCVQLLINLSDDLPIWCATIRTSWRDQDVAPTYDDLHYAAADELKRAEGSTAALTIHSKGRSNGGRSRPWCDRCHTPGHTEPKCGHIHPEFRPPHWKPKRGVRYVNAPDDNAKETKTKRRDPQLLTVRVMAASTKEEWIVDSGADSHCSPLPRDRFLNYVRFPSDTRVTGLGTGSAIGQGTIEIKCQVHDGVQVLRVANVLHVPALPVSLLSASCLKKKGVYLDTLSGSLRFLASREILAYCPDDSGVNVLATAGRAGVHRSVVKQGLAHVAVKPPSGTYEEWHQRLGHTHVQSLRTLQRQGKLVATGTTSFHCEACHLAKSKRLVSYQPMPRVKFPFERIHVDVIGPIIESLEGFRWATVVVDDFSRYRKMFFGKQKSHAFTAIQEFQAWVKTQFNAEVKKIRLDNGLEFGGGQLQQWARGKGIEVERTAPYSPEQNGIAESSVRAVTTMARAMRIATQVPRMLWKEACSHATFLLNRIPSSSLNERTPIDVLKDALNISTESFLKVPVFGTTAYAHIPAERRKKSAKFDVRAEKGLFVGLDSAHVWSVYLPRSNRVTRTRDVRFTLPEARVVGEASYEDTKNDSEDDESIVQIPLQENTVGSGTEDLQDTVDQTLEQTDGANTSGGGRILGEVSDSDVEEEQFLDAAPDLSRLDREVNTPGFTVDQNDHSHVLPPSHDEDSDDASLSELSNTSSAPNLEQPRPTSTPPPPRYPSRTRRPPQRFDEEERHNSILSKLPGPHSAHYVHAFAAAADMAIPEDDPLPKSWREAVHGPLSIFWLPAFKRELQHLKDAGTYDVIDHPRDGSEILPLKWVTAHKFDALGQKILRKARLVVCGNFQRLGLAGVEVYAPVASYPSFMVFLSLVMFYKLVCLQGDVPTAFLNASLSNPAVYTRMPPGFDIPGRVWRLKRALYGLRQSPIAWFHTLVRFLTSHGFVPLPSEQCIMRRGKDLVFVLIYVDDLCIAAPSLQEAESIVALLQHRFRLKPMGQLHHFLGLRITKRADNGYSLSQEGYVANILKRFGMSDVSRVLTPMHTKELRAHTGELNPDRQKLYGEIVGSLMWCATRCHPSILFATAKLSRYTHNPSEEHLVAAKRVLRYLAGVKNYGIHLTPPEEDSVGLRIHADAAFADDPDTRWSSSGYAIMACGGCIFAKSGRQKLISTSTTEAEFVNLTPALKQAIWIVRLYKEMGYNGPDLVPIQLFNDNENAIRFANGGEFNAATKHIDIYYRFVKQAVQDGIAKAAYISTDEMVADGLTKALQRIKHQRFCELLSYGSPK